MRCALSVVFVAAVFCANAALEETVNFSGIADIDVGDERSTMRHAACASGFFVTENGYFVTDKYLTAGAKRLIVVCENKAYEAEPVELPATNRCALLKVKGGPFTPVVFAQDDGGKAGERLLVAGFAASDENGIIPQLSWGVLSGKKIKDEMELFVGVVPEQVGALVTNGKGQFEGMVLGTGRKSQSVCRILKRREIDRSLPIDVRRRFTYVAKYPTPSFDGLGTLMAKCTGLVLVYDEARRKRNMRERGMEGKSFEDDKGLTFEKLETLTEKAKEKKTHLARTGSGFFITADGYFITNQHVVDGAEEVVVLHGGKSYAARVVATSRDKDLALVKMDGVFRPVCAGGTNQCSVGQDVFLVGYPKPEVQGLEVKVTKGIISSLTGFRGDADIYQIDAAIQGGNSGGPAGDISGNVVGVAVASLWNAQLVTYIIKWSVVDAFLPKGVKASLAYGTESKVSKFTDAVKSVAEGTGMVLVYKKGPAGAPIVASTPKGMRDIRRVILGARSAKLEEDWKTVDELASLVLAVVPGNSEAKELYDLAQEKLGRHLIIRAVVDSRDVKARIRPICGFKLSYANCDEPVELYDGGKKRGFPVIARLSFDEDGRHYEGSLETVYDWSGTKEIKVELKP